MKTLTVDDYQRVRLPDATPRSKLAYHRNADGTITLVEMAPIRVKPAKVTIQKRGRFTVGVLDRPINDAAIKQALAEFP